MELQQSFFADVDKLYLDDCVKLQKSLDLIADFADE